MKKNTLPAVFLAIGLLATSPVYAEQQMAVHQSKPSNAELIVPKVSRYTAAEFLQQKGVKAALEKIYSLYPETKSYKLEFPMKSPYVYFDEKRQRKEFFYYSATLTSSKPIKDKSGKLFYPGLSFTVDAETGVLRGINQYLQKTTKPLANLSDEQVKQKGSDFLNKLFGDQMKGYAAEQVIKQTITIDKYTMNHYQLVMCRPSDPNALAIYVSFEGDMITGAMWRPYYKLGK
ncbi:MAG: hypothetical protein ACM32O_20325 [Clostridia bacterium]